MNTVWHVCSLVEHAHTQNTASMAATVGALPNVEVAACDSKSGKMAVVLESDSENTLLTHIASIREIAGTLKFCFFIKMLMNNLGVRKNHEAQSTTLYEG